MWIALTERYGAQDLRDLDRLNNINSINSKKGALNAPFFAHNPNLRAIFSEKFHQLKNFRLLCNLK